MQQDNYDDQALNVQPDTPLDITEVEAPTQPMPQVQLVEYKSSVFETPTQPTPQPQPTEYVSPVQPVQQAPVQPTPSPVQYAQSVQPAQPVQSFEPFAPQPISMAPPVLLSAQPKSKKKWLVPVIVLGAVLLLGGGASAFYFGVYQKPENVLLDAFNKITSAKAVQSNEVVTVNKSISQDITFKDITIKTNTNSGNKGMMDASINLEAKGKAVSVNGKAIVALADGAVYFQVNNLKESLQTIANTTGESTQVPATYLDALDKIQGQWVKATIADVKKNNEALGSEYECAVNAIKKHSNDSNKEYVDIYKQHPFVIIKESLGVKDGRLGYKIAFDTTKVKDFTKSLEGTQLYKDVNACGNRGSSSSSSSSSDSSPVDSAVTDSTSYNVWVDQWSHELRKVEFSGNTGKDSDAITYNGNVDVTYDPKAVVELPASTISTDEFLTRIQKLYTPVYESVQLKAQTTAAQITAMTVVKKAEAYYAINGTYPKTLSDFGTDSMTSLDSLKAGSITLTDKLPTIVSTVGYKLCSATAGQVAYYDAVQTKVIAIGVGDGKSGTVTAFCSGATV